MALILLLPGKIPKEIHAILIETSGKYAPPYDTVKNWVAKVKCGDFPPVMRLVLNEPKP
jgi:hypothetical protein